MKIFKLIILLGIVIVSFVRCGGNSSSVDEYMEDYIFICKSGAYKFGDFDKFLNVHGIEEISKSENRNKLLSSMLDIFIDQKLIEGELRKEKLTINNKEIQSFIDDNLKLLEKNDDVDRNIIAKDLIMQKYLLMKLVSKLNITDEEVRNYYEQNRDKFYMRERIMITQILLEDQQAAEDLYSKLIKKPDILKEIVTKKSVEDIKIKGVIIATYQKGELPEEIEDYLWKLSVDAINKPYITNNGEVMMFILMDKKPGGLATLEEVKYKIIKKLALIKVDTVGQNLLTKLAKENNLRIYQKNLNFIYSGKYMNYLI